MYYVFSNSPVILRAIENKEWEMAVKLLKVGVLVNPEKHVGVSLSAAEVYRKFCEALEKAKKQDLLSDISETVSKKFAAVWDATAISMMASNPARFGELHEDAKVVLIEYDTYRERAIKLHAENKGDFEIEEANVKYVFKNGKLDFVRNGKTYRVFKLEGHY